MKVRHILVALADPAARSSAALEKAVDLARRFDADVTLFHSIYSPYVAGEQFYSPADQQRDIEAAVNERKARLSKLAASVAKTGDRLRVRLEPGEVTSLDLGESNSARVRDDFPGS